MNRLVDLIQVAKCKLNRFADDELAMENPLYDKAWEALDNLECEVKRRDKLTESYLANLAAGSELVEVEA